MSEALAKVEAPELAMERPHPREIIRQATEEANVLAEVIEGQKLFTVIQGKRYVRVEGWTTLATLRGCLPREVAVHEMPEGRYVAEVELIRMSDGMILTRASAECGGDGDNIWRGRPANARRSMAITRATGKACRIAFAWVLSLAGRYETTPAEEMDFVGGQPQEATSGPAPRATEATSRQWPARGVPPPSDVPESKHSIWTGKLTGMEMKEGIGKNKKAYRLYKFTSGDGKVFGTFSDTVSGALVKLEGHFVELAYSANSFGDLMIMEYRDVTSEEVPL